MGMLMLQRLSILGLSAVVACAPASPTEHVSSLPSPQGSSSKSPLVVSASIVEVASTGSASAVPESVVPIAPPETVQASPAETVPAPAPAPEPPTGERPPFESGLDELLDARPIRLTKRSPDVIEPEAKQRAESAKTLAPKAKGKGKAYASAGAAYEELAYALRRELAKTTASTELAAALQTRRKAAEDAALENYFEAIAQDNTLDEAKYRAAHLAHARGNVVSARKQYFILVENHPNSAFVPLAYLAFALLFADEAKREKSKWQFVEVSAQKALEPQGNPATPEALFLIARAQRGAGKTSEFAETIGKLRKEFPKSAAARRTP